MSNNIVTTKFTGWDELQKKLEELPQAVAKKGVRKSLKAGGTIMMEGFVQEAPVKSGFMREHFGMRTRVRSDDVAGSVFVGPQGKINYPARGNSKRTISVASAVRFSEFGTTKQAKNPFMTRAWERLRGSAMTAMIESLWATVRGEAK